MKTSVTATSRYPELRLFRLDLATGRCERLGHLGEQAMEAQFVGGGKHALVRDEGGSLILVDISSAVVAAQEPTGWANTIAAGRRFNNVYFTQGALVRAISLDPKGARAELCAALRGRGLPEQDWVARFGSEARKPTC